MELPEELVDHLVDSSRLSRREAQALVREVVSYFDEPVGAFVARRHSELQREGLGNADIYRLLAREIASRRFVADSLSERQIRRLIYG